MPYQIVIFDVDGTLLNREKKVPISAVSAIGQLRKYGVICVIASARTPFNVQWLLDDLQVDTYIVYNGSLIIHENQVLHQEAIHHATVKELVERVKQYNHSAALEGNSHFTIVNEERANVIENYMKTWNHAKRVPYEQFQESISQIDLFCSDEDIASYIEAYSDLTFYPWVSHPNAFNIIPKGVSKAYGIKTILEILGIPKEQAVAFGDGPNDVEMLSYVGMGVAMGNAVDELKAKAGYVTKHVDEDGIAYGLHHLGLI